MALEALKSLPFLENVPEEMLKALSTCMTFSTRIIPHTTMYIQNGSVNCDGPEQQQANAGDWLNLPLLFGLEECSEIWTENPNSQFITLGKSQWDSWITKYPSVGVLVIEGIARFGSSIEKTLFTKSKVVDRVIVYSSRPYDVKYLNSKFSMTHVEASLNKNTASLAKGHRVACLFTNDQADRSIIYALKQAGVELLVMRCAGVDNVDQDACKEFGIYLCNVPVYGPNSIAEHTIGLILALDRKIVQTCERIRIGDFTLSQDFIGFEVKGKTVGLIGTGRIGRIVGRILLAMECKLLCYDLVHDKELVEGGAEYVDMQRIFKSSDIISLHLPLTSQTHHIINGAAIEMMKDGVMLINTSRGGLIDTKALIMGLKSKKIGSVALDVYENEATSFHQDWQSQGGVPDDILARLTTFPNVLITSHQAYFTHEALTSIATTVLTNIERFLSGDSLLTPVLL